MMLDGTCCQVCGTFLGGVGSGMPMTCSSCLADGKTNRVTMSDDFFVIRVIEDVIPVLAYLDDKQFDHMVWNGDKHGNPVCKLIHKATQKRIATVCVRTWRIKLTIKSKLEKAMKRAAERKTEVTGNK